MAYAGGGHPGMTGRGPGSGIQGSSTGQGPGPGSSTAGHGHPGRTGRGPGSGIAGSATGQGPVGGRVGGRGGGGTGMGSMMGALFGGGMQSTKGDYGGPSIGGRASGGGMANIGMANINSLRDFIGQLMASPERGRSTHAKGFHPTDMSPRDDVSNKAIGDRIGVEASVPGPRSDLGRDFRGRAPNTSTRADKSQARFSDVESDFVSPQTPVRDIRENPFFFDPERQPAVELSNPPRRDSPISLSPPRHSGPTPAPVSQDPGPRGTPAPAMDTPSPRRSDPTPSPASPTPEPGPTFPGSDDMIDSIFGALRQANDFARAQNRRAEFHGRRPGGVGGGGTGTRNFDAGFARNQRGR